MSVTIKFHESIRELMQDWRSSFNADIGISKTLADLYLQEFLTAAGVVGFPDDSCDPDPRFSGGVWRRSIGGDRTILFSVRTLKSRFTRRRELSILVFGLE